MTKMKTKTGTSKETSQGKPSPKKRKTTMGAGEEEEVRKEEDDGDPKQKTGQPLIKATPSPKKGTWKLIKDAVNLVATGYKEDEIYGEKDSLHESIRKVVQCYAKQFDLDPTKVMKETIGTRDWHSIFANALGKTTKKTDTYEAEEKEMLQMLVARLSRTDPIAFGPALKDGQLMANNMTTAWEGAKCTLGSDWAIKKKTKTVGFGDDIEGEWKKQKTHQKRLKQTELSKMRKNRERFDFKIRPNPEVTKAFEGLHERLQDWFTEVQRVDPKARILPWEKASHAMPIDKASDIPDNLRELRTYFPGISVPNRKTQTHSWTKVHITMEEAPAKITAKMDSEMEFWYSDYNDMLHIRPLRDSENTIELGYMTYTGNFINVERFMGMVNNAAAAAGLQTKLGGKIKKCTELDVAEDVRIRYKASKKEAWKVQYWDILHVLVDKHFREEALEILYSVFNNTKKKLPTGQITRFIPHKDMATLSPAGIQARAHVFNKHSTAVQDLEVFNVREVRHLDTPDKTTGQTLREFLMAMKHSVTGRALFHNIDKGMGRNDGKNVVTCAIFSEHRMEAEPIAGVLPALCMQRLAPTTKEWFDGGAVRRCEGVKFAKKGNMFITPKTST